MTHSTRRTSQLVDVGLLECEHRGQSYGGTFRVTLEHCHEDGDGVTPSYSSCRAVDVVAVVPPHALDANGNWWAVPVPQEAADHASELAAEHAETFPELEN